jgi:hypothetical protein
VGAPSRPPSDGADSVPSRGGVVASFSSVVGPGAVEGSWGTSGEVGVGASTGSRVGCDAAVSPADGDVALGAAPDGGLTAGAGAGATSSPSGVEAAACEVARTAGSGSFGPCKASFDRVSGAGDRDWPARAGRSASESRPSTTAVGADDHALVPKTWNVPSGASGAAASIAGTNVGGGGWTHHHGDRSTVASAPVKPTPVVSVTSKAAR